MTAPNVVGRWSSWAPRLLSVLRIFTAFIFIQAGTMKLFAFPMGMPPNGATATPWSEFWIAGVLPALCCFIWLYISAAGAGPWSLDAKRGN